MTEELKALTSRTQIEITDQVNDIDEKVKNTLQELENGTANVITEDELLAKLADYTTNEQFTSVTDNKADKTDIPTDIPNTENLDTIITAKVQEKSMRLYLKNMY